MPSEFAILARAPLTVTVAGEDVQIPYRPAGAWLQAMAHPATLAARLADLEDRDRLADWVMDRPGAVMDLFNESLRLLREAGGRPWWEVGRLMSTSAAPEILGALVVAGVDPWQRSIGEWCAATYHLCTKGQDDKGRLRFDFSLQVPPPGYEDEWDTGEGANDPAATMADLERLGMMG